MTKRIFPLTLLAILLSPLALAQSWQFYGIQALARTSYDAVDIYITDAVSGGCMQKPDFVKEAAQAQLRNNGFKTGDGTSLTLPRLLISAVGLKVTSEDGSSMGCVVSLHVSFRVYIQGVPYSIREELDWNQAGLFAHEELLELRVLTTQNGTQMQEAIEGVVRNAVDELALRTKRSKQYLEKNFPQFTQ